MPMVINATSFKKESYTIFSIRDLEDLVINTMGEDVWNAIMYFTEEKIELNQEENKYTEDDIRSYDVDLTSLRSGVSYEVQELSRLVSYVNDSTRLNRAIIIEKICGVKRRLTENEGY
ncbi:MAG: hypothetical protein RSC24_03895 [Clostridium sp.]|uniref:hypothetical protein n=1 Tax=Clostridium sp. TaxID=1506 RepID=UPI003048B9BE